MSSEPLTDPVVLSWVDEVSAGWGAIGIDPATRQRLRVQLESDLVEALTSGATSADLTSTDPREFAVQLAHAHGIEASNREPTRAWLEAAVVAPRRVTDASLCTTALGSGVLGGLFCIYFVFPWAYFVALPDVAAVLVAFSITSLITLAFVAGGVTLVFRDDPTLRASVASAVIGMGAGGVCAIAPTMVFAHAFGYSRAAPAVVTEIVMVAGFLVAGIVATRWAVAHGRLPGAGVQPQSG